MMLLRRSAARAGDAARRSAARVYARGLASKDDSGPDMDAIMRERKIILSRFGGSKIADAVRADRDKKFEAKAVLLAVDDDAPEEERAFKMPDLEMDHLFEDRTESILGLASKHTATLVTIGMTQHARKQLAAVHEAFLDTYRLDSVSPADKVPGVGLVDCSYANGWAFAALRFVMMPGVRAAVPENMHPYAYSRFESSERATEGFCYDSKFHNRALQCSYLLDRSGMVRWWMHSDVTDNELEAMIQATNALLDEHEEMLELGSAPHTDE